MLSMWCSYGHRVNRLYTKCDLNVISAMCPLYDVDKFTTLFLYLKDPNSEYSQSKNLKKNFHVNSDVMNG